MFKYAAIGLAVISAILAVIYVIQKDFGDAIDQTFISMLWLMVYGYERRLDR